MIQIRKIEPRDFATVAALENENWDSHSTPVEMHSSADKILENVLKGVQYLLATDEETDEILGILDFHVKHGMSAGSHVATFGLMTVEKARHQGIAHKLLGDFIVLAREENFCKLSIEVLAGNTEAIKLYESFDFVLEGRLNDEFYLDGHYVDNLWYGKSLI